jgi:DNA gyrase subunit A
MEEQENNILPSFNSINIEDEMRVSYIDYSMSVIIGRALPDVRDGLKPVHRRVLFAMKDLANYHNRPYKKSARIVGDVIGKYHPHGDTAVYETAVRMAQEFSMRYMLIDGQGNFGSIDGDSAAAMRYTEIRMQRMAEDLLEDLDKETVDFGPNYDESLEQPLVLPAKLPNLLLNGSTGIAVGMATNVPPHNLGELSDAIIYQIDNPNCEVEDLMQFVKGPDFPTGGIICGTKAIYDMYKYGRGHIRVRGKCITEELSSGRERIIITEIPYTVNKAKMIEATARLVNDKVIEGISDIRDESNKDGIRVVIELKRKAMAEVVLNQLYKHTQMQTTFAANVLAIDNGRPKRLDLKTYIKCFTDHRFEVITRRTKFDLRKAEERAHILDGFKIALDNLDELVRIIRAAKN